MKKHFAALLAIVALAIAPLSGQLYYDLKTQIVPVSGGAVEQDVYSTTVTLTDAQIKALPTTGVQILAAQGTGKMAHLVAVALWQDATAGAYSNVDASANVYVETVGGAASLTASVELSGILDDNGQEYLYYPFPLSLTAGTFLDPTEVTNVGLQLKAANAAAGNFTGGNAANTLKVTVLYMIVDL